MQIVAALTNQHDVENANYCVFDKGKTHSIKNHQLNFNQDYKESMKYDTFLFHSTGGKLL